MKSQDLAKQFRNENPGKYPGGVVVVFNAHVAGWMSELRDPYKWEPGCIAINEHGMEWLAVGGDSCHGAKSWQPIKKSNQEAP